VARVDCITWPLLFAFFVFALLTGSKRVPRPLSAAATTIGLAYSVYLDQVDTFVNGHCGMSAVILWFFGVGVLALTEMRVRSWKVKLGDWTWSTVQLLGALLLFASYYYPHIKSSWGGGRPIPVTIYFKSQSVILPGQSVNALLIDETDPGFYVVGKKDNKATLIPRESVGLLYFSDNVSDFSLSKPK
jgi:hypothetical protein